MYFIVQWNNKLVTMAISGSAAAMTMVKSIFGPVGSSALGFFLQKTGIGPRTKTGKRQMNKL